MGRKKKLLTKRCPISVWEKAQKSVGSAFTWEPPLGSLAWSEKYRILTSGESATSGRYSCDLTPYARAWYSAFDDPRVEQISICAGAQIGKTQLLLNLLGVIIDEAPGNLLWVWPDLQSASKFARHRLKLLLQTPKLKAKFGGAKKTGRQEQILFPGGSINFVGSNSPTALASLPCRYVIADEVDRLNSQTSEGSALELARARTRTFFNRKIITTSTPTDEGSSQIVEEFLSGSRERYCFPCPDCKNKFEITLDDLSFELNKKKKVVGSVSVICPSCGTAHTEREVRSILSSGGFEWVAERPDITAHRSFWINSFVSPFISWAEIVEKVEAARGDAQKLRVIKNTLLGETWKGAQIDKAMADNLMSARFCFGKFEDGTVADVPEGVERLVAGIDTQDSYLAFVVLGVGKSGIYCIDHGSIPGVPSEESTITALKEALLNHQYRRADGTVLNVSAACWDSGGHFTTDVYRHCYALKHHRCKIFPIKGQGGEGTASIRPPTQVSIGRTDSRKIKLFILGVDSFKTRLMDFLTRGLIGFSDNPLANQDSNFFSELLSEKLSISKGKSFWEKIHRRNEALDCSVYALAALDLIGYRIEDPRPPIIPACNLNAVVSCSGTLNSNSEPVSSLSVPNSNPNTDSSSSLSVPSSDSSFSNPNPLNSNPNFSPSNSNWSNAVPSNSLSSSGAERNGDSVNNLIQVESKQQPKRRRIIRGFNPGLGGFGNGGLGW